MKSSLKQPISSAVKDIVPLCSTRRYSDDDSCRAQECPRSLFVETKKKNVHTHLTLNPPSKHMLPHKSTVLEQRGAPSVGFPAGSKKFCAAGQESPSRYHFTNDGSRQPVAKKDAVLQKASSYHAQREFALSFFKQLNENLKVEKAVSQSGKPKPQIPTGPSVPISSSVSKSHSSAPQNCQTVHRSPADSLEQRRQQSTKKMDKMPPGENKLPSFSPDSSLTEEHKLCQAATPGSKCLSLKRRRENCEEKKGESKRLCLEDSQLTPISVNDSSSSGSSIINSPPKYIKRAFLKAGNEEVLTIKEKCSPVVNHRSGDKTRHSNHVAKQLFTDKSREPRTEGHKPHAGTQPNVVLDSSNLKDAMGKISPNKSPVNNTHFSNNCTSLSNTHKHCDDGGSIASSHPSSSPGLIHSLPSKQTKTSPFSSPVFTGSCNGDSDEEKVPKHNPAVTPSVKQEETEKKHLVWKDPLDLELEEDMGLPSENCALSLSSSRSSNEEEQLLSLKEILERSARVDITPEKMFFSEPSTPVPKVATEDLRNKTTSYKNTLEQMLKEKEQNQKTKELEMQLLQSCKEDLLKLEDEENAEEALSHEQKEFLQKFSVTSCVIRDIHPGEEVFVLANFGRLFNHETLDLRKLDVSPNNRAQQTLLKLNSEQLLLLLSAGLLRRAYSSSPCQSQVTRWLFQMLSVHPNPIICSQLLQAMSTIALFAAQQIVEKSNKMFKVWMPSIQDIALVFLNMGVSFISLFPLEALQPSFNEGDLLESLEIQPDGTRNEKEYNSFPKHNFENIIKYLALCTALCPRVYTDEELLLLSTVVCRVSLETHLQLLPTADLCCLLQHLLSNMTQWEIQLPRLCQAITDLSEDHHNLRRLVQLLPHSSRGKQLRRHLSVSIISKLLNQRCTYTPSCTEFELSDLRCYLPQMRPSSLLKGFLAAKVSEGYDCATTPDQQAYYLCYSLLALTNEASNFEFLPSRQRNELLLLSAELEKHIKCDIRESEKLLYRSKVKDFVARIYTKWQVLLQRSRPQEGKLYDYWKPLPEDEMPLNQECQSREESQQAATKEPQSEHSESDLSEEEKEDVMEEKDEVTMESEDELDYIAGEIQEKNEKPQEVLNETTVKQLLLNMDDENAKEEVKYDLDDKLLEGSSDEGDIDEDLVKREDELLKDEELVDSDDGLEVGESNESGKLEENCGESC